MLITFLLANPMAAFAVGANSADFDGAYPQTLGKAALLMDASSGRVLYEVNAHQHLSPASVTKIMTALLVAEKGNLNKTITISQNAADTPESSVWLEAGEKLTREQLLYACMLNSANDAAVALAESAAGSEKQFVNLMNQKARQLGMKDSHFCNPHGLETKGHYTSAYDLALLSREALHHDVFRKVVSTQTKNIPWAGNDYDRLLINQNRLLYRYDGAIGVKTGYTKQAGNCVVGAARKGSLVLIAVALNSPSVYQDLEQMLDYGFAHYNLKTVKTSQKLTVKVPVLNGQKETVQARPKTDLTAAVTAQEQSRLTYELYPEQELSAPVKKGQIVGNCAMYVDGYEVGKVDLLAISSVAQKPPFFTRFKSGCIIFLKIIGKTLLGLIALAYLIRFVNLRRQRRRKRPVGRTSAPF
jgi:D-alanyl-D-alanine carboxypeptidase (penicillin-binding protein 5/6)